MGHFCSLDLPPSLAAAWLHAVWACMGSVVPCCAQLCPGLWRNQGLSHARRTHCLTPGCHPLPVNGQDSRGGEDTLVVAWNSRDKYMPVAFLLGATCCMLGSGVGSICSQGWAVWLKLAPVGPQGICWVRAGCLTAPQPCAGRLQSTHPRVSRWAF